MHLTKIFYEVDEFCKQFEKQFERKLLTDGQKKRNRELRLSLSEIMKITIFYHDSGYKTFKDYYEKQVLIHMIRDFHTLISYNRFLELRQKTLMPMLIFFQLNLLKSCTGISYIDSFPLKICHIKRSFSKQGLAQKGKTSMGWSYGFKLHLVINQNGEIIAFCITPGNVADNNECVLIKLTRKIFGKLFGDEGYLINENIFAQLYMHRICLFTGFTQQHS